jgi:diaminopimelate decarboxylase
MSIWPLTAEPALSVGGVRPTEIAERFGTPAYVVDEEHVRVRCREYAKAMAPHEVAYAAKAFWCSAMARWIAEEGLSLDVCSEGELAVAGRLASPASTSCCTATARRPASCRPHSTTAWAASSLTPTVRSGSWRR